jgi:hypothetical protein
MLLLLQHHAKKQEMEQNSILRLICWLLISAHTHMTSTFVVLSQEVDATILLRDEY